MEQLFPDGTPESVGIDGTWLVNFLERLEDKEIPIHSAIIMRHDTVCMETYYQPYTRDTLHRMFSITKSFVSLGIGLLADEGKISLDDKIVDYFPEKIPADGAHPYLKMLTIRDMLTMRTCHDKTTYKFSGCDDWVGSFFTVTPTHVPGTNFSYDTSSAHTMGALIEKLSGMKLLDYLRSRFLDEIGFSKDAYVLTDPSGVSIGGSGLCATPYDILKVLYVLAHDGNFYGNQLLPADYVRAAKSMQSDPYAKQPCIEERQGYGYQIWLTRNNGFCLYGMGGQLALYAPDKDIFMVTTADTQGRQDGIQAIYDAFWEEIYYKINSETLPENEDNFKALKDFCGSRKLFVMKGEYTSPVIEKINDAVYTFDDNSCGMKKMAVKINSAAMTGVFSYENATGRHNIDFGFGKNLFGNFPDYNLKYAASASFRMPDTLLIKVQIIDYAVGNMYISVNFKGEYVTVMFRKLEESLLTEYSGVACGKRG
jgi:CubicO group peptidase (beta-lactamase class C family)